MTDPRPAYRASRSRATRSPSIGSAPSRGRSSPTRHLYPLPNRPGEFTTTSWPPPLTSSGPSGRRQGRREPVRHDRIFGRFSYQNYKSEPERAPLESQLTGTNDSPFLGLAFNWNRTLSRRAVNELLVGFTHVKFQTIPVDWAGIGDANATIGIPGGQPIPGLSSFNITATSASAPPAIAEFNDIKSYQVSDKYSWFKGRHQLKFGGRWLYQRQGFSYSGNEGILGHFDYNGHVHRLRLRRLPARPGVAEGPRRRWWRRSRISDTESASTVRTTSASATISR